MTFRINIFNNSKDISVSNLINEYIPVALFFISCFFFSRFPVNDWYAISYMCILTFFSLCRFYQNARLLIKQNEAYIFKHSNLVIKFDISSVKQVNFKYIEEKHTPFRIQFEIIFFDNSTFTFYITRHIFTSKTKMLQRIIAKLHSENNKIDIKDMTGENEEYKSSF